MAREFRVFTINGKDYGVTDPDRSANGEAAVVMLGKEGATYRIGEKGVGYIPAHAIVRVEYRDT